jgi:large subunit ribosomal protein L15
VEYQPVNLRALEELTETEVNPELLKSRGLIGSLKKPVKILGTGDLTRTIQLSAHAISASARAKIEGAGGSVTLIER